MKTEKIWNEVIKWAESARIITESSEIEVNDDDEGFWEDVRINLFGKKPKTKKETMSHTFLAKGKKKIWIREHYDGWRDVWVVEVLDIFGNFMFPKWVGDKIIEIYMAKKFVK